MFNVNLLKFLRLSYKGESAPWPALTPPFGMHHPLWDAFPVKVGHLVCEHHVLDQQGAPGSGSLQVQLVSYGMAGPCGQSVGPLLQEQSMLEVIKGRVIAAEVQIQPVARAGCPPISLF